MPPARATIELQLREPAPRAAEATERELLRRYIDVWDRDDANFLSVIDRLVEPIPRGDSRGDRRRSLRTQMTTPERYVAVTTRGVQHAAV